MGIFRTLTLLANELFEYIGWWRLATKYQQNMTLKAFRWNSLNGNRRIIQCNFLPHFFGPCFISNRFMALNAFPITPYFALSYSLPLYFLFSALIWMPIYVNLAIRASNVVRFTISDIIAEECNIWRSMQLFSIILPIFAFNINS